MALREALTESGAVRGCGAGNNDFTVFKSIPYAAPPVGDLRWKRPQKMPIWEGVRDCVSFRPIAAQESEMHPFYSNEFYRFREPMSEDCLNLSIWTPAHSEEERLPVLVFFHGGAFRSGYHYEITIDGEAFCAQGIVFVSVDYRLGALGYMAHTDLTRENNGEGSGNWGMFDQIEAIRWIRRNISSFGGDPSRITISGQSAGAISVQNLLASPMLEKGEICGAILESGGGLDSPDTEMFHPLTLSQAEEKGKRFLSFLGVSSIEEARAISWEMITELQKIFVETEGGEMFCPMLDQVTMIKEGWKAILESELQDIPMLIGTTSEESGADRYTKIDPVYFQDRILKRLGEKEGETFLEVCGLTENPQEASRHYGLNDALQPPVLAYCEYRTLVKKENPVWLYYFSRELPGEMNAGAYHSSELWYVFRTVHRCHRPLTGLDYQLARTMNTYWGNFVKYGDPNGAGLPKWHTYEKSCRAGMELGERTGMRDYPGSARSRFLADYILRCHGFRK